MCEATVFSATSCSSKTEGNFNMNVKQIFLLLLSSINMSVIKHIWLLKIL